MKYVLIIAAVVVGLRALMIWLENAMLYLPWKFPQGDWRPELYGLQVEDCFFSSRDGVRLHAWYVENTKAKVIVLFFHGNSGNISTRIDNLLLLRDLPARVLIVDYRGYGRSSGRPSEKGLYCDAEAAYDFLVAEKKATPSDVVLFGRSLGSGVASELALRRPCAGIVLEAAFTSMPAVAGTLFPVPGLQRLLRNRYDNLSRIGRIGVPKLIIHGEVDDLVPAWMGRKLHDAASAPKSLYLVRGAGHADCYAVGGQEYRNAWLEHFAACADAAAKPL